MSSRLNVFARAGGPAVLALVGFAGCMVGAASAEDPIGKLERTSKGPGTAWITTRDGKNLEGSISARPLRVTTPAGTREIPLRDLLSLQTGGPASPSEKQKIE